MSDLSIIIPTLNEEKYIPTLLNSIILQAYTAKLQVVVVDASSTDNTKTVVRSYMTRFDDLVIVNTKANIGLQRNLGVKYAKYEHLLFLDADVTLPKYCLQKIQKKYNNKSNYIAAIFHKLPDKNPIGIFSIAVVYLLFFISWLARTPVVNGDFIFTTKKVHNSIHGFKEGAIIGEDTDYGIRATRDGAKYSFIWFTYIVASDRRAKKYGYFKLLRVWSKAFIRARKVGPTYSGVDYPFGGHNN